VDYRLFLTLCLFVSGSACGIGESTEGGPCGYCGGFAQKDWIGSQVGSIEGEPAVCFELTLEGECHSGCGGSPADVSCVRWDREAQKLVEDNTGVFQSETDWENEVTVTTISAAESSFEEGNASGLVKCSISEAKLICTISDGTEPG